MARFVTPKVIQRKLEDTICATGNCNLPSLPKIEAPLCAQHAKKAWIEIGQHYGLDLIEGELLCVDPRHARQRALHAAHYSKDAPDGLVYIIRMGNRIKIGFTRNLTQRMRDVPNEEILAVFPGSMADEGALHKRFDEFRTVGEWFTADPSIIAYAEEHDTRDESERGPRFKESKTPAPRTYYPEIKSLRGCVTATEATKLLPVTQNQIAGWAHRGLLDAVGERRPRPGLRPRPVYELSHIHRLHTLSSSSIRLSNIREDEAMAA